jgi:hypothetical protein
VVHPKRTNQPDGQARFYSLTGSVISDSRRVVLWAQICITMLPASVNSYRSSRCSDFGADTRRIQPCWVISFSSWGWIRRSLSVRSSNCIKYVRPAVSQIRFVLLRLLRIRSWRVVGSPNTTSIVSYDDDDDDDVLPGLSFLLSSVLSV